MEDLKNLLKIAKKVLEKKVYKKIKTIKEKKEKIDALKYAIILSLEKRAHEIEREIENAKKQNKDVFFPSAKSHLVLPKIKMLKATFHKRDLKNVLKLFEEIEKELKNV